MTTILIIPQRQYLLIFLSLQRSAYLCSNLQEKHSDVMYIHQTLNKLLHFLRIIYDAVQLFLDLSWLQMFSSLELPRYPPLSFFKRKLNNAFINKYIDLSRFLLKKVEDCNIGQSSTKYQSNSLKLNWL